jgi:hypothetical protein
MGSTLAIKELGCRRMSVEAVETQELQSTRRRQAAARLRSDCRADC